MTHRKYYWGNEKKHRYLREQYMILIKKMLNVAARAKMVSLHDVGCLATRVMEFEKTLANVTIPLQDRRDPEKQYNKMLLGELPKALYMKECLQAAGFDTNQMRDGIIVDSPIFFDSIARVYDQIEKNPTMRYTIQAYLAFHVTLEMANFGLLGEEPEKAYASFQRARYGPFAMASRSNQCQGLTVNLFGDAVGAVYVKQYFSKETKQFAVDMISKIRRSFLQMVNDAEWMDRKTRLLIQDKIKAIESRIGYGKKLDTYGDVSFRENDYEGGLFSALAHRRKKQASRVGKLVDKEEWWFSPPQDVNAYYFQQRNEIFFPAGILQHPLLNNTLPDAMNYGGIGSIMGHEIGHSVDNRGRQYDKAGRLSTWWRKSAIDAYKSRTKCFIDLYNTYKPPGTNLHVMGKFTLDENLADVQGVKASYEAFKKQAGTNANPDSRPSNRLLAKELTNNQLFFVAYAQNWCSNYRGKLLEEIMMSSPHSPGMFRVQGPLSQFKEFANAFKCKHGTRYNPANRCKLW